MKVLLELKYIGSAYHGWQVQENAPSVQKTLQNAAEELLRTGVSVTGCSRTDAGVHARQYFCTLESDALIGFPLAKLPTALNCLLPDDISARSARAVGDDFHPRYRALAKEYEYLIYCAETRDAFFSGRAYMMPGRMPDVEKMQNEAQKLVGRHDFTSFCASGGKIEDKTRTVYACSVKKQGEAVVLRISADGFLYNMVRIIAGTLFEIGLGKSASITEILQGRNRSLAGRTAPPEGLYLNRVFYERSSLEEYLNDK